MFLFGIFDSSFLFLPFGNDLLLIALVSTGQGGRKWIYYVIMASLGSLVGVFLADLVMRKAGEEGLERFVKPELVERLKTKMEKRAGWAVFGATLIPPPFPFTAVVLTASALQFSRWRLLVAVFSGRLVRFTAEALLALYFGRRLLRFVNSDVVEYVVYGLIAVAVVGSFFSIRKWVGSRRPSAASRAGEASK